MSVILKSACFDISRAVASSPAGPAMAGPVLARTFENINDYYYLLLGYNPVCNSSE